MSKIRYIVRYRDPINSKNEEAWETLSKIHTRKKDAIEQAKKVRYYQSQVLKVRWDDDYGHYVPVDY